MKRTLTALVVMLSLASSANALSLHVDSDKLSYVFGETITITATLDTTLAPPALVAGVALNWNGPLAVPTDPGGFGPFGSSSQVITVGLNVGAPNLTSSFGIIPWLGPPTSGCDSAGPSAGNTCVILNQINFAGSPPDPATLVGTLQMVAGNAAGPLNFNLSANDAFGAPTTLGANFQGAFIVGSSELEVEIDIKPGNPANPIQPFSRGVIAVAILGSESFDVADVDVTTLAFGPAAAPLAHRRGPHPKDANHDGVPDLLAHFMTEEAGIAFGDEEACVTGKLLDGSPFEGCDSVRTVSHRSRG
jgi:hypothetical protein